MQRIIAIALVALVAGFWFGWSVRGDREAAKDLKATQEGIQKTQEGKEKVDVMALVQSEKQATQVVKDRVITREVIKYVEVTPDNDRCTLPGPWRVQHDAAATGEPADTTGVAIGEATPVADDTALSTVTENYIRCRGAISQVEGWQEWWDTAKNY